MKCPRCAQQNPPQGNFCPACGTRLRGDVATSDSQAQLQNDDLRRALAEAAEQQAATAEILKVISSSPSDVQPVFDTIIRNAVELCGVRLGAFFRFDGEQLHLVAYHGHSLEACRSHLRRSRPRLQARTRAAALHASERRRSCGT